MKKKEMKVFFFFNWEKGKFNYLNCYFFFFGEDWANTL